VTHALDPQHRSESELNASERQRLESAHRELSDAVADYERRFAGGTLRPGEAVAVHRMDEMSAAQTRVDRAEAELWRAREDLLGWRRPEWAPRASLVSDWFCEEDAAYDAVPDE
jgi:hypothetical protein